MQLLSSFSVNVGIEWPFNYNNLMRSFQFINIDPGAFVSDIGQYLAVLIKCFSPPLYLYQHADKKSSFFSFLFFLDPCTTHISFLEKFTLQVAFLPGCITTIILSMFVAKGIYKLRGITVREHMMVRMKSYCIARVWLIIIFVYPGIVNRTFRVLQCQNIDGVDYLKADYTKICWVQGSRHELAFVGAIVSMIVFVFGIPFAMFISLFLNRKHIHNPKSKQYKQLHEGLGSLFVQYEQGELIVLVFFC